MIVAYVTLQNYGSKGRTPLRFRLYLKRTLDVLLGLTEGHIGDTSPQLLKERFASSGKESKQCKIVVGITISRKTAIIELPQ